jgi:hypothetical protein
MRAGEPTRKIKGKKRVFDDNLGEKTLRDEKVLNTVTSIYVLTTMVTSTLLSYNKYCICILVVVYMHI